MHGNILPSSLSVLPCGGNRRVQFLPFVKGTEVLRSLIFVETAQLPSSDKVGVEEKSVAKDLQPAYTFVVVSSVDYRVGDIFSLVFGDSVSWVISRVRYTSSVL